MNFLVVEKMNENKQSHWRQYWNGNPIIINRVRAPSYILSCMKYSSKLETLDSNGIIVLPVIIINGAKVSPNKLVHGYLVYQL